MSYYEDVYLRRLNRYGDNYQDRLQHQREKVFEDLLLKSPYRVDFVYNNISCPALLERYKQDETQTLQYLLTRIDLNIPGGTILTIDGTKWMIYWLEHIEASGYNRYVVMRMSHTLAGRHKAESTTADYTQDCYFFGKRKMAIDRYSNREALYIEESTEYTLITPFCANIKKDDYFEISTGTKTQGYRVLGFDIVSTEGVQYITVDPTYIYDKSPAPVKPAGYEGDDYDWITGDFNKEAN